MIKSQDISQQIATLALWKIADFLSPVPVLFPDRIAFDDDIRAGFDPAAFLALEKGDWPSPYPVHHVLTIQTAPLIALRSFYCWRGYNVGHWRNLSLHAE
jgi:hypothetical protein